MKIVITTLTFVFIISLSTSCNFSKKGRVMLLYSVGGSLNFSIGEVVGIMDEKKYSHVNHYSDGESVEIARGTLSKGFDKIGVWTYRDPYLDEKLIVNLSRYEVDAYSMIMPKGFSALSRGDSVLFSDPNGNEFLTMYTSDSLVSGYTAKSVNVFPNEIDSIYRCSLSSWVSPKTDLSAATVINDGAKKTITFTATVISSGGSYLFTTSALKKPSFPEIHKLSTVIGEIIVSLKIDGEYILDRNENFRTVEDTVFAKVYSHENR